MKYQTSRYNRRYNKRLMEDIIKKQEIKLKRRYFFIITNLIICLDQIIKHFVVKFIDQEDIKRFIGQAVRITYTTNTGGAFSLMQNSISMVIIFNVFLISILVYFIGKNYNKLNNLVKISMCMIIGGGIGNLLDRIFRGHVVDYIDINNIFNYPVFNLADILIVVGIIATTVVLIISVVKEQEKA